MNKENCRIWIVDDNKEFLRDLEFALRLEGWKVSPYDAPTKFLEELNFDCPGCIILDSGMAHLILSRSPSTRIIYLQSLKKQ